MYERVTEIDKHRAAFPEVLMAVHKQAALEKLQQEGAAIEAWDAGVIAGLNSAAYAHLTLTMVGFDYNRTRLPRSLFGASYVEIELLKTPFDVLYQHDRQAEADDKPYNLLRIAAANVEHPAKAVSLQLATSAFHDTVDAVEVFSVPGLLPCAVRIEDLTSVVARPDIRSIDSDLLGHIVSGNRPEAVQYLSESICAALARLIVSSRPHIPDWSA